jgi:hypothetical protein
MLLPNWENAACHLNGVVPSSIEQPRRWSTKGTPISSRRRGNCKWLSSVSPPHATQITNDGIDVLSFGADFGLETGAFAVAFLAVI